jgi:hypothetical protein
MSPDHPMEGVSGGRWNSCDLPLKKPLSKQNWRAQEVVGCIAHSSLLILDLGTMTGVGISLASNIIECLKLSNTKAISYYGKRINFNNISNDTVLLPATFTIYIFRLDKCVILPGNIHISRDNNWTEGEAPTGHHSINATYEGMTGIDFVDKYPVSRIGGHLVCGWPQRRTGRSMTGSSMISGNMSSINSR